MSNKKHGMNGTRLHNIWKSMKHRCHSPKYKEFKNYGGRGIAVCEEWQKDFLTFYHWAIANGYNETLTIDRIDVNGNYEPNNCRWATQKEQQNNRSNNRLIAYNGETHTISEWAEIKNINVTVLWQRLYRCNWGIEKALETVHNNANRI